MRIFSALLLALILTIFYQNCGNGFDSLQTSVDSSKLEGDDVKIDNNIEPDPENENNTPPVKISDVKNLPLTEGDHKLSLYGSCEVSSTHSLNVTIEHNGTISEKTYNNACTSNKFAVDIALVKLLSPSDKLNASLELRDNSKSSQFNFSNLKIIAKEVTPDPDPEPDPKPDPVITYLDQAIPKKIVINRGWDRQIGHRTKIDPNVKIRFKGLKPYHGVAKGMVTYDTLSIKHWGKQRYLPGLAEDRGGIFGKSVILIERGANAEGGTFEWSLDKQHWMGLWNIVRPDNKDWGWQPPAPKSGDKVWFYITSDDERWSTNPITFTWP